MLRCYAGGGVGVREEAKIENGNPRRGEKNAGMMINVGDGTMQSTIRPS